MIESIRARDPRLVVGVASGRSLDAIDAVLLELSGGGESVRWRLLDHQQFPWGREARELLARASRVDASDVATICLASALAGELFARAVERLREKAGVGPGAIALVGSDGPTIHHQSEPCSVGGITVAGTLQLGEPGVIAERTGTPVVSGFRSRDLAAGGHGSPLLPFLDRLLLRDPGEGRIALHLGGIASLTILAAEVPAEKVAAFDTGPGTVLIDLLVQRLTGGEQECDHDGAWAARGSADETLLAECLDNPYFEKPPPKCAGPEEFGPEWIEWFVLRGHAVAFEDLVATVTELAARSIVRAIEEHVLPEGEFARVLVSGGGFRNRTLLARLRGLLGDLDVESTERWGIPPETKSAIASALLANEFVLGRPVFLPEATGAIRPAILGSFTPGAVR